MKSDELLRVGRITTVIWGAAITGMAFLVGGMSGTIVEAINKIGSAFYGPILASFLVGVLSKRVNETGVIAGVVVGVAFNLGLWIFAPGLYWMWWNLTGLIVAAAAAFAASALAAPPSEEQRRYTLTFDGIVEEEKKWLKTYAVLITYFAVILSIVVFADDLLA